MRWGVGVGVMLGALALCAPAQAHPGDLDDSFGTGGIVQTDPTPEDFSNGGLAVGGDGRAFYVEDVVSNETLVGLTKSGDIDESFGDDGRVKLKDKVFGATMAVSPTGKVLVAGYPADGVGAAIARVTKDGRLDPTFGDKGVLRLNFPGFIADMDFDSAGRLIVLINDLDGEHLIRLNDSGAQDTSFGNGGRSPAGVDEDGRNLLIGADGSMFVVFNVNSFTIEKFTPEGQLDTSFGQGGISTPDSYQGFIAGGALTIDPLGRLIYVRTNLTPPLENPGRVDRIYRLTPDGQPDASFQAAPELLEPDAAGNAMRLDGILADNQGRILLSGSYGPATFGGNDAHASDPLIARILPDGALDQSFGDGGVSRFPLSYSSFPFASFGELLPAGPNRVMSSGGAFISRIELDDAVGDADADKVRDKKDGCPRRYSERSDGCGRLRVKLSIDQHKGSVSGRIKAPAPCLLHGTRKPARVSLFEASQGGSRRLGRAKVDLDGNWSFREPSGHPKVYASYPQHRSRDIAVCRGAESKRVHG